MKFQIRSSVFETNSSSVHSLTLLTKDQYNLWFNGDAYISDELAFKIFTRDEIIEELKYKEYRDGTLCYPDVDWNDTRDVDDLISDCGYTSYEDFGSGHESSIGFFKTPNGEEIVTASYYGYDG